MTSESIPTSPQDETPIDAEFEPARPPETSEPSLRGGPGWSALAGVCLIAVVGLFLATANAGFVPGLHPGSNQISALAIEVERVTAELSEDTSQTSTLVTDIATLESRADSLLADRTRGVTEMRDIRGEIETLKADISTLQRVRVASLAAEASAPGPEEAGLDRSALNTRMTALEDALVSELSSYDSALENIKTRIDALENAVATDGLRTANATNARTEAALALSAIEAAARRGRPFLTAHQKLAAALPGNEAVDRLAPIAGTAIPTLSSLRIAYPPLMERALDQAASETGGSAPWMRNLFGDGIQVRQQGSVTSRDHLDRAEAALRDSDLAAAIEHVRAVDADLQPVFTDWVNNAEDRHQLEQTLEALRLTMIAKERP